MNEEFNAYTRDDLISEIRALKNKYHKEFKNLVVLATEAERESLNNEKINFLERTKEITESSVLDALRVYEELYSDGDNNFHYIMSYDKAFSSLMKLKFVIDNKKILTEYEKPVGVIQFFYDWIVGKNENF